MIKPKYPKNADLSQIARIIVERAAGEPLRPLDKPLFLPTTPVNKDHKTYKKAPHSTTDDN
jgi:hypothetical protein